MSQYSRDPEPSSIKQTTTQIGKTKVVMLSGEMTFDHDQMMRELGGKHSFLFGDVEKLIAKLPRGKLSKEEVEALLANGTSMSFYENIWCYMCIRPSDFANYMFSHIDSENRANNFQRIRNGVCAFFNKGFDIYIIPCS